LVRFLVARPSCERRVALLAPSRRADRRRARAVAVVREPHTSAGGAAPVRREGRCVTATLLSGHHQPARRGCTCASSSCVGHGDAEVWQVAENVTNRAQERRRAVVGPHDDAEPRSERHVLSGGERMCSSDASRERSSLQKLISRSIVMNQLQPANMANSSSRVGPTMPTYCSISLSSRMSNATRYDPSSLITRMHGLMQWHSTVWSGEVILVCS
jgi:hypothetical protein